MPLLMRHSLKKALLGLFSWCMGFSGIIGTKLYQHIMLPENLKEIYEKTDLNLDADIESLGVLLNGIYALQRDIASIQDPTIRGPLEEKINALLNTIIADHLTKKKEFIKNYYKFVETISSEKS